MQRLKIEYAIEREPFEKSVLTYRDKSGLHSVEILAGNADDIEVFREKGIIYVLSWNLAQGYAGMEAFKGHDKVGELYIQNQSKLEELLGKKGLDLTPINIAKRLLPHIAPISNSINESSRGELLNKKQGDARNEHNEGGARE